MTSKLSSSASSPASESTSFSSLASCASKSVSSSFDSSSSSPKSSSQGISASYVPAEICSFIVAYSLHVCKECINGRHDRLPQSVVRCLAQVFSVGSEWVVSKSNDMTTGDG